MDNENETNQSVEVCFWCEENIDIGDGIYHSSCEGFWFKGWLHKGYCDDKASQEE